MAAFMFSSLVALTALGCLVALAAHVLWKAIYEAAKLPSSGWVWWALIWLTRALGILMILTALVPTILFLINQPGVTSGDSTSTFFTPSEPPEWRDRD